MSSDPTRHVFWITSRAAGTAAIILASLSVLVGLLMSMRLLRGRGADLSPAHEALSLLTLGAVAVLHLHLAVPGGAGAHQVDDGVRLRVVHEHDVAHPPTEDLLGCPAVQLGRAGAPEGHQTVQVDRDHRGGGLREHLTVVEVRRHDGSLGPHRSRCQPPTGGPVSSPRGKGRPAGDGHGRNMQGLAQVPADVSAARSEVRSVCVDLAPDTSDAAQLALTELLANALRHGSPPIHYEVERRQYDGHACVFLAVDDTSSGAARARAVGPDAESGRGLAIVHALSCAWGDLPRPGGKRVWALIG